MKIQQLNEHVYIADQINVCDISTLRDLGIRSIINNRPDNESENQPLSKDICQSATAMELDYQYLPVISNIYPPKAIAELIIMLEAMEEPIVMFCRTGNRSANLWALSQIDVCGRQYVIDKTQRIGFNTSLALNN